MKFRWYLSLNYKLSMYCKKCSISNSNNEKLTVALVGRPNTGKSTLFNRLTKSNSAIVSHVPGTTRDRKEGLSILAGLEFVVIDTGGLDDRGAVSENIKIQVSEAVKISHVVLFLLDAKTGMTSLDHHFSKWLRKIMFSKSMDNNYSEEKIDSKKLYVVANKTEGAHMSNRVLDTVAEALNLGFGDPLLISAANGEGIVDIAQLLIEEAKKRGLDTLNEIQSNQNEEGTDVVPDLPVHIAIMGKPNVGKSTLINALVKKNRVIAGPEPGLTRDSVSVEWQYKERKILLVDTAGLTRIRANITNLDVIKDKKITKRLDLISNTPDDSRDETNRLSRLVKRKNSRISLPGANVMDPETDPSQFSELISELSLLSALNALRYAQVIILVVESSQGKFSKIDLQLANKCLQEGRGLIIAANKEDVPTTEHKMTSQDYEEGVRKHAEELFGDFGSIPVVACSGLHQSGLDRLMDQVLLVHDGWTKRISTSTLNHWLKDLLITAPTPRSGMKSINIKYITQVKTRPPTFALFANVSKLPTFFERYLQVKIQNVFQLHGSPVRFIIRKSKGNEVKKHLLKTGWKAPCWGGRGVSKKIRTDPHALAVLKEKQDSMRRRSSRLKRNRQSRIGVLYR